MSQTMERPAVAQDLGVPAKARTDWVDNYRLAMIVLVVNMHACVTYSHFGSWYYKSDPEAALPVRFPLAIWQAHLQAFFMGALFFLGGVFAERSLAKKGPARFLGDRAVRLGAPLLLYMLVIQFVTEACADGWGHFGSRWLEYLSDPVRVLRGTGPLWFAEALLILCVAYVPLRGFLSRRASAPIKLRPWHLVALGVGLGVASFLVRLVYPVGSSFFNLQFAYCSQYVVLFGIGAWLGTQPDGLTRVVSSPVARKAGWVAAILGPIAMTAVVAAALPNFQRVDGGWNPYALGMALWEQVTGVALAVGTMAFAFRHWNHQTAWSKWLSDRAFGVYVVHAPVLTAITVALQPHRVDLYTMILVTTVLALVGSFVLADLLRRIPGLRIL
jgi:peptidoglycan/LPS O-acetylase OafA/YrhL